MKRRFLVNHAASALAAVLALVPLFAAPTRAAEPNQETAPGKEAVSVMAPSAAAAILVDGGTGRVLYERNAREQRSIASITKLMTALVAVESAGELDGLVTVEPSDTRTEGSSMYLRPGEELTLETLLYGLLLSSGNDAALAIARHCAGDVETFVGWMNQRAESLGMIGTQFANPNGLNDEGHYSTAADMARLAVEVMKNETLAKIVGTKSITLGERTLNNHNKLLWQYEGCAGMKTGYTEKAGRTLVSCARRDGQLLIAVTLDDPNDWKDHKALFDYGFETYPLQILARAEKNIRQVPVDGSLTRFVLVKTASDVFFPTHVGEKLEAKFDLPTRVDAPVEVGEIAGSLSFYLEGTCVGKTYLVYAAGVRSDRTGPGSLLSKVRKFLDGGAQGTFLTVFYTEPRTV